MFDPLVAKPHFRKKTEKWRFLRLQKNDKIVVLRLPWFRKVTKNKKYFFDFVATVITYRMSTDLVQLVVK